MQPNRKIVLALAITATLLAIFAQAETPEEIFLGEKYHTGFVNISDTSDIFYWYFPSLNTPENDGLVFWLTGGPGCSSVLALFTENGNNIRLKIKQKLIF